MTPDDFRAALAALGLTQAAFARYLADHGHPARDVARSVRRWAQIGPPGEVVVILEILRSLHARGMPVAREGMLQARPTHEEIEAKVAAAREVINDAWRLLMIARSGCDRTVRDRGSDVALPHEVRMFARAFSPEGRDGPAPLQVRGEGQVYHWFKKARTVLGKAEGHKP